MQQLSIRLPHTRSVFLVCIVPCGAIHDPWRLPGLAHFTEHMVARNARVARRGYSLEYEAAACFGAWMDAYTTPTETCYEMEVAPEYYDEAAAWLRAVATTMPFEDEDWNKEQRVLWLQLHNQASISTELQLRRWVYGARSRWARPVAGTIAALRQTTPAAIRRFWSKHYRPEKMFWLEVGALPHGIEPETFAATDRTGHFLTRPLTEEATLAVPIVRIIREPQSRRTMKARFDFLLPRGFAQNLENLFSLFLANRILELQLLHHLRHLQGLTDDVEVGMAHYPLRTGFGLEAFGLEPSDVMWGIVEALRACCEASAEDVWTAAQMRLRSLRSLVLKPYELGQVLQQPTGVYWMDDARFTERVTNQPAAYVAPVRDAACAVLRRDNLVAQIYGAFSPRVRRQLEQILQTIP